jgi:type IV secretory pathway TrbL component
MLCHHILAVTSSQGPNLRGPFGLTATGNDACCLADSVSMATSRKVASRSVAGSVWSRGSWIGGNACGYKGVHIAVR